MALKYLILHESPTESSTVNKFLPPEYFSMSTWGHFMEILSFDKKDWSLNWGISCENPRKKKLTKEEEKWNQQKKELLKKIGEKIKEALGNGGKIILATDPDREGAVIATEIIRHFNLKPSDYIVHGKVTDLNKEPYLNGIKNYKKDIDWELAESGYARQILDQMIGFELTENLWALSRGYKPFLEAAENEILSKVAVFEEKNAEIIKNNKKIQEIVNKFKTLDFKSLHDFNNRKNTSFGRVQSSVLCLLISKELEKFDKQLERKINIFADDKKKLEWEFSRNGELENNISEMERIFSELSKIGKVKVTVKDVKIERKEISPPDPMDTQKAQTSINNLFGYSLKKIMDILQTLFENGFTTYMRTDTDAVPDSYRKHLKNIIELNSNEQFLNRKYKESGIGGKEAQGGHEGILPAIVIDLKNIPNKKDGKELSKEELKVLEYVVKRSAAAFMENATIDYYTYQIEVETENGEKHLFILKDAIAIKKGFLEIFDYNADKYIQKVFYKKGDEIIIEEFRINEKNIKLSGGYTEGSIVKELKELGIGRPSTWQSIVGTLVEKEYIKVVKNSIEVTPKGYWIRKVILDKDYFDNFPKIDYTSKMEESLDKIAEGKEKRENLLSQVNLEIEKINSKEKPIIEKKEKTEENQDGKKEPNTHWGSCPACKQGFIEKKEVNGKTVWSCTNWKNKCKFTIWGEVSGYKFSDTDVLEMIKNKKSQLIEKFISKAGNPFPAYYVFDKTKGFTFEFPPRK